MLVVATNLMGLDLGQLSRLWAEFVAFAAKSLFKLPGSVSSRDGPWSNSPIPYLVSIAFEVLQSHLSHNLKYPHRGLGKRK